MIEALKRETAKHSHRAAVVPIERLQDIQQDLADLKSTGQLNQFQQFILNDLYSFDLPDAGFEIRSIILVAAPSPAVIPLRFTHAGNPFTTVIPASYMGKDRLPRRIEHYLAEFLAPHGYHLQYAPRLPHKRLAVRSGLAEYGRNNICYVAGMGSFLNLNPYFSDLPCPEDPWREVRQMDLCHTCQACLNNCPTAAILLTRFLIDNERCLTYFNEAGAEYTFPAWIDPAVHHTLYGCLRCQIICPANRPYAHTQAEPVEFSALETDLLLQGKPFEQLPEVLRQKVESLEMTEYLGAIPRNLGILFQNLES